MMVSLTTQISSVFLEESYDFDFTNKDIMVNQTSQEDICRCPCSSVLQEDGSALLLS